MIRQRFTYFSIAVVVDIGQNPFPVSINTKKYVLVVVYLICLNPIILTLMVRLNNVLLYKIA